MLYFLLGAVIGVAVGIWIGWQAHAQYERELHPPQPRDVKTGRFLARG